MIAIKHIYPTLVVIFVASLLTACAGRFDKTQAVVIDKVVKEAALLSERDLSESAALASHATAEYAQLQAKIHPPNIIMHPEINLHQHGMDRLVDLNWTGPVDTLVKKVAELANYRYKAVGQTPAIPIFVTLHRENAPLTDLITAAQNAAKNRAEITIDVATRTIILRHFPW